MTKNRLLVLKGLPASGKSTYARELVAKGWKRVNKDDLRAMIDCGKWSRENEKQVLATERNIVEGYLRSGYNVVVDDTNFSHEEMWRQIASQHNADFTVEFFDIPVDECIKRDAKRGDKSVGAEVILRMYNQYLRPELQPISSEMPDAYIFDIDGTLAKMDGRSPYDYTKVLTDKPNRDIVKLNRTLSRFTTVFVLSGREASCIEDTKQWLRDNDIFFDDLIMRETGDRRDDRIVKKEMYEKYIKGKWNVVGVFDDRDRVVSMWRDQGLTCLQVDYGSF